MGPGPRSEPRPGPAAGWATVGVLALHPPPARAGCAAWPSHHDVGGHRQPAPGGPAAIAGGRGPPGLALRVSRAVSHYCRTRQVRPRVLGVSWHVELEHLVSTAG